MVVRSWSELDFDNVCSNAKVFGFDLDNTLASSKQPMKPAMIVTMMGKQMRCIMIPPFMCPVRRAAATYHSAAYPFN